MTDMHCLSDLPVGKWVPIQAAPFGIDEARELFDRGLITMAQRGSAQLVYRYRKPQPPHEFFGRVRSQRSAPRKPPPNPASPMVLACVDYLPKLTSEIANAARCPTDTAYRCLQRAALSGDITKAMDHLKRALWSRPAGAA